MCDLNPVPDLSLRRLTDLLPNLWLRPPARRRRTPGGRRRGPQGHVSALARTEAGHPAEASARYVRRRWLVRSRMGLSRASTAMLDAASAGEW